MGSERFPFAPLERWLGAHTVKKTAKLLDVDPRQIYRWRSGGVREDVADRLAIGLGLHPGDLWPEWWR